MQSIDNLYTGINEIQNDKRLKEHLTTAGGSIQDIAETKGIQDEEARLELLKQRSKGEINRTELRKKVKALKAVPKDRPTVSIVITALFSMPAFTAMAFTVAGRSGSVIGLLYGDPLLAVGVLIGALPSMV